MRKSSIVSYSAVVICLVAVLIIGIVLFAGMTPGATGASEPMPGRVHPVVTFSPITQ